MLPPSPPPPPPPGEAHARPVRWGLGDVAVGIGLFFAVQLFFGAGLVAFIIAVGGELAVDDSAGDPSNLLLLLVSAPLSWAVLIGWPWWVSRRKGTGRMSADFGLAMRWTDLLLGVAGGVLALVVSASLAVAYSAVFGGDAPTNTDIISGESQSLVTIVVLFVVIAVGTPIAEEIFFRGLVLGAARKRWGTAVGIAFSSLLFGAFHVQADLVSWAFVGAVTALYGVVFALLRVWSNGRIAASIVAHMVVNAMAIVVVVLTG